MKVYRLSKIEWEHTLTLPTTLEVKLVSEGKDFRWEISNYLEKNFGERPVFFECNEVSGHEYTTRRL